VSTTTPQIPVQRFDCFSFLQDDWSSEHKSWCCDKEKVACERSQPTIHPSSATTPIPQGQQFLPYDCAWKYDDWRSTWSTAQAEWCCKHAGRGCQQRESDTGTHVVHTRFQKLDDTSLLHAQSTLLSSMRRHGRPVAVATCAASIFVSVAAAVACLRPRRHRQERVGTVLIQEVPEWDQ
jgi:hypothetical protein